MAVIYHNDTYNNFSKKKAFRGLDRVLYKEIKIKGYQTFNETCINVFISKNCKYIYFWTLLKRSVN